jgi:FixJ family two-component response regulator
VITDLRMPRMSGAELQQRLIADGNDTPIIFMSADSDDNTRFRVLNAGAVGFLRKPIDAQILVDCLDKALALKAA